MCGHHHHYHHHWRRRAARAGTTVTDAMDCTRKAWVRRMVDGGSSAAALLGTLMHELVQHALIAAGSGAAVSKEGLEQHVSRRTAMCVFYKCMSYLCKSKEGLEQHVGRRVGRAAPCVLWRTSTRTPSLPLPPHHPQ